VNYYLTEGPGRLRTYFSWGC